MKCDKNPLCSAEFLQTPVSSSLDPQSAHLPKASSGCCLDLSSLSLHALSPIQKLSLQTVPLALGFADLWPLQEKRESLRGTGALWLPVAQDWGLCSFGVLPYLGAQLDSGEEQVQGLLPRA